MADLPVGTVTFLFTDVEGSTRLVQELGDARFGDVLQAHHAAIRSAVGAHGGLEVGTEGDSFFAVFDNAPDAVAAATAAQRALAATDWPHGATVRVRMGLHTGLGRLSDGDYVGVDVHRAARVAAAAAGGQVLLTRETALLVDGRLPDGTQLNDLGRHRLKDLDRPETLVQVAIDGLEHEFPPVSVPGVVGLPTGLPPMAGRERELREIIDILGDARLLSVTGPGGSGKTRICAAVAEELAGTYADGVYFVELGAVSNPEHVVPQIGAGLELPFTLYDGPTGLSKLTARLRDRDLLLILDNFEQIMGAAPIVGEIVDGTSRLSVLVASRAPLRLHGEHEYPLEPLPVPAPDETDPAALASVPSVALFVERATRVRPDFALTAENAPYVVEVTRRLEGLPLALELAAARTKVLSLPAISERLGDSLGLLKGPWRDRPDRQQTISDAIRWSYELLDEPAQRFFAAFSTFQGGARLGEVEAAWQANGEALELIGELLDQSLIHRVADEGPRFAMLSLIHAYAAERLRELPEGERMEAAHARVYADLGRELGPQVLGTDRLRHLERLEEEHGNLRIAIGWLVEHDPDAAAQLGVSLWRFWHMRGYIVEGLDWMQRILDHDLAPERRLAVLIAASGLAYWVRDIQLSAHYATEAIPLAQAVGERRGEADALYNLAFAEIMRVDAQSALALIHQADRIFRDLDDEDGQARCAWATGVLQRFAGSELEAIESLQRAADMFRRRGDVFHTGWAVRMLGRSELMMGRTDDARGHLRESMAIFVEAGDLSGVVLHLADFCFLALLTDQMERAYTLFGAKEKLRRVSQTELVEVGLNVVPGIEEALARGGAEAVRHREAGEAMSVEDAVALALAT